MSDRKKLALDSLIRRWLGKYEAFRSVWRKSNGIKYNRNDQWTMDDYLNLCHLIHTREKDVFIGMMLRLKK